MSFQTILPPLAAGRQVGLWWDFRLLPAAVSLLSLPVLLAILLYLRLSSSPSKDHSATSDDHQKGFWRATLSAHLDIWGGRTILAFDITRLLGTIALTVLSAIDAYSAVSRYGPSSVPAISELALTFAYSYTTLLSIFAFLPPILEKIVVKYVIIALLLTQFVVFAWRNLAPLMTFEGIPADVDQPVLLVFRGVLLLIVAVLVPMCTPRGDTSSDPSDPTPPPPEETVPLLSFVLYTFLTPLIKTANKLGSLPFSALPHLASRDTAAVLWSRGKDVLDPLRRREQGRREQNIALGLWWVFKVEQAKMALYLVAQVVARFMAPVGINRLLNYLETGGKGALVQPWAWIGCIFLAPTLNTMLFSGYTYTATRMVVQAESLLVQLLLHHAFRIRVTDDTPIAGVPPKDKNAGVSWASSGVSTPATSQSTAVSAPGQPVNDLAPTPSSSGSRSISKGKEVASSKTDSSGKEASPNPNPRVHLFAKINNMFGTDIGNITQKGADAIVLVVDTPLQVTLSILFLYVILGWSALIGIGFMALTLPLPGLIVRRMQQVQRVQMGKTDLRVQTIGESLSLIRMIKMFAWEPLVRKQISERRDDELYYLQMRKLLNLASDILLGLLPMISMTMTFAVYTLVMKQDLDASKVFSSLPVFDQLSDNMSFALDKVSNTIKAKVSCDRVTTFLYQSSLLDRSTIGVPSLLPETSATNDKIGFHHATFTWREPSQGSATPSEYTWRLHVDDLVFETGQLNIITGPTACGKTSILMALLGEMHFVPESVDSWVSLPRQSGVAYAAQESWVQNESIKNNIIFESVYDETRYKKVLYQCGLEPDLALFTARDETEVGEKGLTLSGGQKARVTLARAVYSTAAIVLLDDILSALDVHTARWIVERCLQGDLLRGRTIILVTHAIALVGPIAHKIISMDASGAVVSQGSFLKALSEDRTLSREVNENEEDIALAHVETRSDSPGKAPASSGKLIIQEEVSEGRFRWSTMKVVLDAFGGLFAWSSAMFGFIAAVAADTVAMWWLGHWAQAYQSPSGQVNVSYYLSIFIALVMLQQLSYGTGAAIYTLGTTRASRKLHAYLCDSILGSTFRWLDITPVGRMLSRLTQDIGELDSSIPEGGQAVIRLTIKLILKFSAAIVFSPAFIFPGILMTVLAMWLGHIYMVAQMAVKRSRSNWRSPLYSHLGASVVGLVSIRAFKAEEQFENVLQERADAYTRTGRTYFNLNRWIAIRMNVLGGAFAASLAAYLTYSKRHISASNTGFSLHMAIEFSGMILWWIRNLNSLEVSANSLERIRDYLSIPHEAPATEAKRAPAYWPASGSISAQGLSARYSNDGPLVLKELSFDIKSGERIGIVGRTGSGKSSLTLALLQLIPTSGELRFDDRAANDTNLDDLRSNMTIIPQEPMLLSGTIRSNLDPYSQHDDATLYNALQITGLLRAKEDQITLDTSVANGGSNFSVGQRQLIALARAILRGTHIVILDEATAAVDHETDALIQASIRTELQHATLVTVAHRLLTIMDYDRIMVLSEGQLAEFDTPYNLLQKQDGYFRSLVEQSGEKEALVEIASKGRVA